MTKMMRRKADRRRLEPMRRQLGLTQQEVADRLGVHVRTWAKWIAGERACPWSVWLALQAMTTEAPKPDRSSKSKEIKKGA
jgi:DNA-binding transcriptional regulator YiaG